MKYKWYKRKDGVHVLKSSRYKVLEIFKRPHKGYCCAVFRKGGLIATEGFHGTSLLKKHHAVRWGVKQAKANNLL